MKRWRLGLLLRAGAMLVHIAVNQLSVLGAARVLDQQHMAAARALQRQYQQAR
jgi:hypothetical protein